MQFVLFVVAIAFWCGAAVAEQSPEFTIEGTVLRFDTVDIETTEELSRDDLGTLLGLLRTNPEIQTLQLDNRGGNIFAALRIADVIIDFGLDTEVDGDCVSACTVLLLAGERRTMTRGSRVGFHERNWSAKAISSYYDRNRNDEGWTTVFDMASQVYVETQQEAYEGLIYMVERGVDPSFAIETLQDRGDGVWYPRRKELLQAGVLTE